MLEEVTEPTPPSMAPVSEEVDLAPAEETVLSTVPPSTDSEENLKVSNHLFSKPQTFSSHKSKQ